MPSECIKDRNMVRFIQAEVKLVWVINMFSNPIFYNKDAHVIKIPANYCHDLYTHVQNSRVKQLQK